MGQEFDAVFSQGHLIPLEPLELREDQRVRLRIEQENGERLPATAEITPEMTLHDALAVTGLLGSLHSLPADLSTNPSHMEGFGEHDQGSE